MADDGAYEFVSDRNRSNPKHHDALWQSSEIGEIGVSYRMDVFNNEHSLGVGYLTAAYGLWFKSFGYSWVFQRALDGVRRQMLAPDQRILNWNFVMESKVISLAPSIGVARFGDTIFPVAHIYDHFVILPTAKFEHPPSTPADKISVVMFVLRPPIHARYQHRCVGPATLVCDGQNVIVPDVIPITTVPIEPVEVACWGDHRREEA